MTVALILLCLAGQPCDREHNEQARIIKIEPGADCTMAGMLAAASDPRPVPTGFFIKIDCGAK